MSLVKFLKEFYVSFSLTLTVLLHRYYINFIEAESVGNSCEALVSDPWHDADDLWFILVEVGLWEDGIKNNT